MHGSSRKCSNRLPTKTGWCGFPHSNIVPHYHIERGPSSSSIRTHSLPVIFDPLDSFQTELFGGWQFLAWLSPGEGGGHWHNTTVTNSGLIAERDPPLALIKTGKQGP